MIPVWKEVLCCGWQIDPVTGERYEFKPPNIRQAHRNFQKMFKRGVPCPAIWEHQKIEAADAPRTADEIAEWKRRYAKFTFAHLADSRINERGNLDILHHVIDPADAKQLEKTKFVSPKVYRSGYWDSKGGIYEGTTIAHVAATPTPVQFWQKPFAVNLSETEALYLAYEPPVEMSKTSECPHQDESSFDEWLDSLADDTPDDPPVELSTTEVPEESPVADDNDDKPSDKDGEGDGGEFGKLVKALKGVGMNIPDEVKDIAGLIIAVKASGGGDTPDEVVPDVTPDATAAPAGGAPMMMSTLDKHEGRRKKATEWAKDEREDVKARVEACFKNGQIDGPTRRKLLRNSQSVEMSFTADGDLSDKNKKWSAVLTELTAAEQKQPNSVLAAQPVNLSSTAAPPLPNFGTTEVADADNPVLKLQRQLAAQYSVTPPAKK